MGAVFPAQAGMIPSAELFVALQPGIPRASGDDPMTAEETAEFDGYSPRKRG